MGLRVLGAAPGLLGFANRSVTDGLGWQRVFWSIQETQSWISAKTCYTVLSCDAVSRAQRVSERGWP